MSKYRSGCAPKLLLVVVMVLICCGAALAEWLPSEAVSEDPSIKSLAGWNHWGIAADTELNWHVVWEDSRDNGYIYYRKYIEDSGWGADEEKVSVYWPADSPAIAVDCFGNVHIVWGEYGGGYGKIYYREKSASAGWDTVATRLDNPDKADWSPSVTTDSEGNVHVVYTIRKILDADIRYVKKDPVEGWLQGYIISHGDGVESSYPTICVDDADNLHVVWIGGDPNGHSEIYYIKYTGEVGWDSLPTRITWDELNTIEPSVAVDGLGCVHVVWRERGGNREEIGYRGYTPGVGWDAEPTQISPEDSLFGRFPSVAADPFGGVHVVWQDYDPALNGGGMYHREFDPGSGWLEPEQLTSAPDEHSWNPDIAANACGDLGVLYENNDDDQVYLKRRVGSTASVRDGKIDDGDNPVVRLHPNPFSGLTELSYLVGEESSVRVRVEVFDVQGRLMRTLFGGAVLPGEHRTAWNGCDCQGRTVSPGVYFARVTVGHRSESRPVVLIK